MIKLTASNFLLHYILHPNSKKLSETDQKIAKIVSVILGLLTAGLLHLGVWMARNIQPSSKPPVFNMDQFRKALDQGDWKTAHNIRRSLHGEQQDELNKAIQEKLDLLGKEIAQEGALLLLQDYHQNVGVEADAIRSALKSHNIRYFEHLLQWGGDWHAVWEDPSDVDFSKLSKESFERLLSEKTLSRNGAKFYIEKHVHDEASCPSDSEIAEELKDSFFQFSNTEII